MSKYIVKAKKSYLKAPLSTSAGTVVLREFLDTKDNNLALADFGSWFVIVIKQGDSIEMIKCSAISIAADGTATLTVASSGRNIDPTEPYAGYATGLAFQSGAEVIVTNDPLTMSQFGNINATNTWALLQTFTVVPKAASAPTDADHLVNKAYADALALGTTTVNRLVVAGTAGATLAAGNLIYFDLTDNEWKLCDADDATTLDGVLLGIAQGAGVDGGAISGGVLLHGVDLNRSGLTIGDLQYASNSAGGVSSSAGTNSKIVGIALTTTSMYFDPLFSYTLTATQAASIPTAGQKQALAGTLGTPSTANPYVTKLAVSDGGADQSQATQNATVEVGEADATTKKNLLAQSFIPAYTKIRGVKLHKAADTGTFTGTVKVALQADSSGSPSGSDLASITLSNAVWLALAAGEFDAIFGTEYTALTVGNLYWIVVTCSTADNSNHPNLGTNSAGGYASGSAKYKNVTDSWVAISTIDLYFKTLIGITDQTVETDSTGKIDDAFLKTKKIYLSTTQQSGGTSTASEVTLYTARIPANSLLAGRIIEFEAYISSIGIQNTFSLDLLVKLGGTTLANIEIIPSNSSGWSGILRGRIYGVTNSTQKSLAELVAWVQADSELAADAAVGISKAVEIDTGSASIDMTLDQNLTLSVLFSGSHGSNGVTAETFYVKVVG